MKIWRELQEKPIVFPADWDAHIGSAYALDLKPIKWEHKVKKSYNHDEVQYFRRNIPNSYGTCESKGESYAIYKQEKVLNSRCVDFSQKNQPHSNVRGGR